MTAAKEPWLDIWSRTSRHLFAIIGDHRRLTAREKQNPKSIISYPADHKPAVLHNRRYGKNRGSQTKPSSVD